MSTKTLRPSRVTVIIGVVSDMRVCICVMLHLTPLMRPTLLLLDLFIYLNFEQKKQQESPFVDIFNLHGKNIAPIVLFITLYPMMMGIVLLCVLTKKIKPLKGTCVYSGAREIQITLLRYAIILLDNNFMP